MSVPWDWLTCWMVSWVDFAFLKGQCLIFDVKIWSVCKGVEKEDGTVKPMMGMPDTENVVVDVIAASVLSCNTGLRLFELQIVNYLLFF